jgi:hypothetical protein
MREFGRVVVRGINVAVLILRNVEGERTVHCTTIARD